jgi:hypothetical protein
MSSSCDSLDCITFRKRLQFDVLVQYIRDTWCFQLPPKSTTSSDGIDSDETLRYLQRFIPYPLAGY